MTCTKKQKRWLIIAAALMAALLALVLLLLSWFGTAELADLNRASSLDHALGKPAGDLTDYVTYSEEKRGGSHWAADGTGFITVSAFPDVVFGAPRVTAVCLLPGSEAKGRHVLGIAVGDTAKEVFAALEEHGYEVTHSGQSGIRAERGKIALSFTLGESNKVTEITARIFATNLMRVQY